MYILSYCDSPILSAPPTQKVFPKLFLSRSPGYIVNPHEGLGVAYLASILGVYYLIPRSSFLATTPATAPLFWINSSRYWGARSLFKVIVFTPLNISTKPRCRSNFTPKEGKGRAHAHLSRWRSLIVQSVSTLSLTDTLFF